MELGRHLLADLLRLPLTFKLFLLFAAAAALWDWLIGNRTAEALSASESWPVYKARVVWAQVTDWQYDHKHESSFLEGVLTYSYTVPGHDVEVGEFRKRFDDSEEASAWARALRDTFIDVRVDPTDVTRSDWQEIPLLTAPPHPMPQLESSRLNNRDTWDAPRLFALSICCIAVLGAFFAAWVQLSCFKGKPLISPEESTAAFFSMHAGAVVCAMAITFAARRAKWSGSNWRKSLKGVTTGLGIKALGLYTTVVFTYGWIRMMANDGDRILGTLMFSAGWLLFYVSAAATSLHALQDDLEEAS